MQVIDARPAPRELFADNDLLCRIRQQDTTAFELLVLKYAPLVRCRVSFRVGRRRTDLVDDVCQQVWSVIWQQLALKQAHVHSIEPWISTIARHEAVRAATREKKRAGQSLEHDVADDPSARLAWRESLDYCLEKLTPRLQRLVELRLKEGRRREEACPLVGLHDLNHCSKVLGDARGQLQACLENLQ